jgi:hypothetical protein
MKNICLYLLTLTLFLQSCNIIGFNTYVLNENDIRYKLGGIVSEHPRFSFEYPRSFILNDLNKPRDIVGYNKNLTEVQFTRGEHGELESFLFVSIFKNDISDFSSMPLLSFKGVLSMAPDVQTIETQEIPVAGVNGTLYIYSPKTESKAFYQFCYFEYSGFNWLICLMSYQSLEGKVKSEFDHIINTFKFLD